MYFLAVLKIWKWWECKVDGFSILGFVLRNSITLWIWWNKKYHALFSDICYGLEDRRRQDKCMQIETVLLEKTRRMNSLKMGSNSCKICPIISVFVWFLLFLFCVCSAKSLDSVNFNEANQSFHPGKELHKLKIIRAHLMKINKPAVKTIQVRFCTQYWTQLDTMH